MEDLVALLETPTYKYSSVSATMSDDSAVVHDERAISSMKITNNHQNSIISTPNTKESSLDASERVSTGTVTSPPLNSISVSTNTAEHKSLAVPSSIAPNSTIPTRPLRKTKPFIPRGLASHFSGPSYPSSMRYPPSSAVNMVYAPTSNRSVSLPSDDLGKPELTKSGDHVHTNRIVSLPESTSSVNSLLSAAPVIERLVLDENELLIDFSSPLHVPKNTTAISSPIRALASLSDMNTASTYPSSPPSTPGLSEGDGDESVEFVQGFAVHISPSFLRSAVSGPLPNAHLEPSDSRRLADQSDHGWISPAAPKPIPALHGPSSLPYARCPSGAEGIVISEQSALPRMVWGLGDNGQTAQAIAPILQTPKLPDQQQKVLQNTPQIDIAETPRVYNTPTIKDTFFTPISLPRNISKTRSSDLRERVREERGYQWNPTSRDEIFGPLLEPAIASAAPSGYTEYHYADSPQWQEFVPGKPAVVEMIPNNSFNPPRISSKPTISHSLTPLAHSRLPSTNLSNQRTSHTVRTLPTPPSTISPVWHMPSASLRSYQSSASPGFPPLSSAQKPKLRDLHQVVDRIANVENVVPSRQLAASVRQFWSPNQPGPVQASTLVDAPIYPPGIPLPTRTTVPPQGEKSEPYSGALAKARSIPLTRLRRKLTTVSEERESDLLSPRRRASPVIRGRGQAYRVSDLDIQAETQTVFGGITEEGLRVRLPPKSLGVLTKKVFFGDSGEGGFDDRRNMGGKGFMKRVVQPKTGMDVRRGSASASSHSTALGAKENRPALASPTISDASATSWSRVAGKRSKSKAHAS